MKAKLLVITALLALLAVVPLAGVSAQDTMMSDKIACDSTLAVLLLVAESKYDYLSHMAMDEMMMDSPALHIDLGALTPVADSIMMAMQQMAAEGDMDMSDMTAEEQAAHDQMLADMMAMSPADQVTAYMSSMNMEMMDMSMLPAGDLPGEAPECAAVRADVERFLVAHILTEQSMMSMDGGM